MIKREMLFSPLREVTDTLGHKHWFMDVECSCGWNGNVQSYAFEDPALSEFVTAALDLHRGCRG